MAAKRDLELLHDRSLADSARHGREAAFEELYRRHAAASWRLALAVTRQPIIAGDAVASAFGTTLASRGDAAGEPSEQLRITLLRATRRAAINAAGDRSVIPPSSGARRFESSEPGFALVGQAFDALPERWRSILWLVDVEGCTITDAAGVLELAPASAAALSDRARLGLRERVLSSTAQDASRQACRRTTGHLSGYVAGTLATSDERRVRTHLDGCVACRHELAALDDVVPALRGATLALPVLLVGDAARRWSTLLVPDSGPLHIGLPGGRPMPAWAERTLVGAVAAVIALGVTGATIVAGRGRGSTREDLTRPVTAVGESALGEPWLSDLTLGGPGFVVPVLAGTATDIAAVRPGAGRSGVALPRTDGPPTTRTGGTASPGSTDTPGSPPPGPTSPSPDPNPGPDPTPPPGPTGAGSLATVAVPGVLSVTVGEACTGGQILATVVGCAPPTTDGPVTLGGVAVPSIPLGL